MPTLSSNTTRLPLCRRRRQLRKERWLSTSALLTRRPMAASLMKGSCLASKRRCNNARFQKRKAAKKKRKRAKESNGHATLPTQKTVFKQQACWKIGSKTTATQHHSKKEELRAGDCTLVDSAEEKKRCTCAVVVI